MIRNKPNFNQMFIDKCGLPEDQKNELIDLYKKYYEYIYKYEIGYPEDFDYNSVECTFDIEKFAEQLYEEGYNIKCYDGY